MNRRKFLKSLSLAGLVPALPNLSFAAIAPANIAAPAVPVISAHTYKWAEILVRAHNKCNISMLERLLQLDSASATALRQQLLSNGIITAEKTAYGMHKAVKPLYQEIMPRKSLTDTLHKQLLDKEEPQSTSSLQDDSDKLEGTETHMTEEADMVDADPEQISQNLVDDEIIEECHDQPNHENIIEETV